MSSPPQTASEELAVLEPLAAGAEHRFVRTLIDAGPHLLWVADDDGRVRYYNARVADYAMAHPEAAEGWEWQPMVHAADLARTEAAWVDAVASGRPYACEHRLQMTDGTYRWHESHARRVEAGEADPVWFGIAVDVHAHKETEAALVASDGRFRALFEAIDEGFCVCELVWDEAGAATDYRFLEANPLFEEMTGLVDAVGRCAYEMVPELERSWLDVYTEVALTGTPRRFEQHSEAMGRWFDVFVTAVAPAGRFAIVFTDVTDRIEAAAELEAGRAAAVRDAERSRLLAEVVSALEAAPEAASGVELLVDLLVPAHADAAWVEAGGVLVATAGCGGHGPDRDTDTATDAAATPGSCAGEAITVPFQAADGGRPSLAVVRHHGRPPFHADDEPFMRRLADRVGVVIAANRLRDEQRRVSIQLQRALLPGGIRQHDGIDIAVCYESNEAALEVGGDWYESFAFGDGTVGLCVGDVVGHDLEAAVAMGSLRAGLLALAGTIDRPGALLAALDDFAATHSVTEFATAFCASYDPASRRLRYASAGHLPALVLDRHGARLLGDAVGGPLGLGRGRERGDATTTLEPDSLLVLYSDGLVERRGESLDEGLHRLQAAATAVADEDPRRVCAHLVEEMIGTGYNDDVVLLCARIT